MSDRVNHETHYKTTRVKKRVKILNQAVCFAMMDEGKTNQEIADAFGSPPKRVMMMRTAWKKARGLPIARRMGNMGSLAERLDARLDKSGPPHPRLGTPCWLYPTKLRHGYGEMQDTRGELGPVNRRLGAHRVAWMLANRTKFPPHEYRTEDPVVRHKCDVPLCCNPDHLEIGTQKQNIHDAIERGLFKPGTYYRGKKGRAA